MQSQKGGPGSGCKDSTMQMNPGAGQRLLLRNMKGYRRTKECCVNMWVLKALLHPPAWGEQNHCPGGEDYLPHTHTKSS